MESKQGSTLLMNKRAAELHSADGREASYHFDRMIALHVRAKEKKIKS